jgi:trans-2,3-dihydro-3-hydroxyanthranilate isomerase
LFCHFRLIDVFAERPFSGRPAAVFTDARGLNEAQMQTIARELGFPQTAFVVPPDMPGTQVRVRIFTPFAELGRGEHLSLGTVFALDAEEKLKLENSPRVVLQDSDGPISVSAQARVITVKQKPAEFGPVYRDVGATAASLGLTPADLRTTPLQAVSAGIPFLIVPVKDPRRIEAIRFRADVWERTIRNFSAPHLAAFALTVKGHQTEVKARVFMPALGVQEDPATEGAAGPIVAYMVTHRLAVLPEKAVIQVSQGAELGRPSLIQVFVAHSQGRLTEVRIGGQCQMVGEGTVIAP